MAIETCGGADLANALLPGLIAGKDFTLPDVDLTKPEFQIPELAELPEIAALTNADLTTGVVGGTGTFDALMKSLSAHLIEEYKNNRISGAQYTEAYIGVVGGALGTAAQFLLGRDQAYWNSVLAQQQAQAATLQVITARVQLETTKAQLAIARYQAMTAEADYALKKMQVATADVQMCLLEEQKLAANYTRLNILPAQREGLDWDNRTKDYTYTYLLPKQRDLLQEQIEVQRAQTLDTRTTGQTITGSVGKQKDLYTQQITSYQRDAEVKAAKLFTDAWITQKTIDEGLLAPTGFTNASLDTILTALKTNNGLT